MSKDLIIKHSLEYGNVYVREENFSITLLEQELGFEITKRFAKNTDVGWILERKTKILK